MPDRVQLSTASELLADREKQGVLEHAGQAFLHSLVQSPINGVVQISDKAFGTNVLPAVQFIEAPKEAQFGSKEWHSQQLGQAAGMIPWFVGLHKGSSMLIGRAVGLNAGAGLVAEARAVGGIGAAEAQATARMAEGFLSKRTAVEVSSSALSGLTYGALLTPVKPGEDLVSGRVTNAVSSSLTFATLSASMRGLDSVGVRSHTAAGLLSGVPAGIVAAESHSILSGKGAASLSDVGKSIYGFSLIGGGFGFAQGRMEARSGAARIENAAPPELKVSPPETAGRVELQAEKPLGGASSVESSHALRGEPLRVAEVQTPAVPTTPAEIMPGQKVVVRRDGEPVTLEVAATTERMVVLKEPKPVAVDRSGSVSAREFSHYTPVEITIDGQVQTRYIMSSNSQIRSSVYKAEPMVGGRFRMTEEPGFSASNRPEVFQWADTARVRSGSNGAPAVDWSIVPEMRTEMEGGLPPQRAGDAVLGEKSVYSGQDGMRWDIVSLRSRGDTLASCSQSSGMVVLEKPGQPWVAEMKDGRCITMESPGPWEVATPVSKRVITKDADGHVKIHDWEGGLQHTIRNPEAPQYHIILGGPNTIPVMEALPKNTPPRPLHVTQSSEYAGAKKQWLSDGTRVEHPKTGGQWEAIRPDGSKFNAESPGPWKIIDRSDRLVSKDAQGVVRRVEGESVRVTHPDGTVIQENLSGNVGAKETSIRWTSTEKSGEPTRLTYEDPAVPGQKVTQIQRFSPDASQRINASEFDWEGVRPDGERFNYDSAGPWEVSLPHGTTIAKDAAGNMTCHSNGNKVEYRVNGDRVYTDRNSTTIYKADKTRFTLYNGCTKWLKESPTGKKSEVDSPDYLAVPQTPLPDRVAPAGDPFSTDYW
ncbi:MAG: hypothetical protein K2W95_09960 [Candidatus Obscuribacterales bacterium]|nr:hypothetical protein [Candidatus Obscuribacterales bacterium]